MAIFKCKMCGGTLEINNETVAVCQYCGTKQTLPKLDDDRKANLYDRANHFRRNNEFDKAMGIYEQILNEDGSDAEAYWSLVLCRYGIEYVEDPSSHKRIPTVNRAQFTSIFDDEDYKAALQYADGYQKDIYEQEATAINDIQKGILAISSQEEPFDVFICYKESDANGRRTPDSVLATELYHELTREGYKVFFSRITLEDKLGSAYEPYIFAALNSAKVMVVLGTKPEYFTAVWVKNEWSRYLASIKNGARKMLIPAYKDMDPYDLPEEFSHLQAQDMSKLGFMQDLIRGIKKIVEADNTKQAIKETIISNDNAGGNVNALLKRGFMALEDGEWTKADDFFEQCLNQNAELAEAYLGKLMAELQVKNQDRLKDLDRPFDDSNNYQKAIRFGDEILKAALTSYIEQIITRNEISRIDGIYNQAKIAMDVASTEDAYRKAASIFETIHDYMDSSVLAQECYKKAEDERKETIYIKASDVLNVTQVWIGKKEDITVIEKAIEDFQSIADYKDSQEKISLCYARIDEHKAKAEADRLERERQAELARKEAERIAKRNKKIAIISAPIICAIVTFIIVIYTVIIPNAKYNDAIAFMDAGNVVEAYETLISLNGYKDSEEKASSISTQYKIEKLKSPSVGDYVFFGAYEQDNNTSNGKEDIEWLVLEVKGGKALVISKHALTCEKYNLTLTDVTWETCSIRNWLNNTFIHSAFTPEEKALIPTVPISTGTYPENITQDQLFLLSTNEAYNYFSYASERQCSPTDAAIARGVYVNQSNNSCFWWLRSPGDNGRNAARVSDDGDIFGSGYYVNTEYAVRPAMWINVETSADSSNNQKPNLDWVAYDSDSNDNSYTYNRIEPSGTDTHYRYALNIDKDENSIGGSKTLYKNTWSSFEGGRITGRMLRDQPIEWDDTNKVSGKFTMYSDSFTFNINGDTLTIVALGEDSDKLAGTYKQELPE